MFEKNTKILVVDDMLTMRKIVKKQLKDSGYENLVEAENGKIALQKIQDALKEGNKFQLIISDWSMPEMQGIDLLKAVRADANADINKLPFLMVTAEAEKDHIMMAIQAGVSNYVVKPFSPQSLMEKLEAVYKKCFGG